MSADNANFIIDELWPVVAKEHNLVIAKSAYACYLWQQQRRHCGIRRRGIGRISLAA